MSSGPAALQPTFMGHVATTNDALILFEACLSGQLSHVPRRPHDRERSMLIRSGCIFIYEENASGIKRWTDGVTWSPSRILGNFLIYRELEKPFPPGEKKRAMRKANRSRPNRPGEPYNRPDSTSGTYSPTTPSSSTLSGDRAPDERERALIGSLVDSYGFKAEGLVKKTMSVTVQGVAHHLVSYYSLSDVFSGLLRTPSQTESLGFVHPRPELTSKQSFRSPLEEREDFEGIRDQALLRQASSSYRPSPLTHPGYVGPAGSYYAPSVYHPGSSHSGSSSGYPPGGSPFASQRAPPPLSTSHTVHQADDYSTYPPPTFHPPYEPVTGNLILNSARSGMPSTSRSPLPSHLHLRNPSQNLSYSSSNSHHRAAPPTVNASAEARNALTYQGNSPNIARNAGRHYSGSDGSSSRQTANLVKMDTREIGQGTKLGAGAGAYSHDRQQYYLAHHDPSLASGGYPSSGVLPTWTTQSHAQQHI